MRRLHNEILFSPSDLARFVESPFSIWMDRYALDHPGELDRDAESDAAALLKRAGREHELRVLERLRAQGREIVIIDDVGSLEDRLAATKAAIEAGAEVIHQAALRRGNVAGYADFLIRSSDSAPFRYTPLEAKVARRITVSAIVQVSCYGWMLEPLLGQTVEDLQLALGGDRDEMVPFHETRYFFAELLQRFVETMERFDAATEPQPEPQRNHAPWASYAAEQIQERRSIAAVATLTPSQFARLLACGVETIDELAAVEPGKILEGVPAATLSRLALQAKLQIDSANEERPLFEATQQNGGLASLPAACRGDAILATHHDPLDRTPRDFLWGCCFQIDGQTDPQFVEWWAHDADEESAALSALLDWVEERRQRHPEFHLYHFGGRSIAALRRVAVDRFRDERRLHQLIDSGLFVDLSRIVRNGVAIGVSEYTPHNLAALFREAHQQPPHVDEEPFVLYDAWRHQPESGLDALLAQHREQLRSLLELHQWLQQLADERKVERNATVIASIEATQTAGQSTRQQAADLGQQLTDRADSSRPFSALLAQLLHFHAREEKPGWWRFLDQRAMTEEQLGDDFDCLAGLRKVRLARDAQNNRCFRYDFDPTQQTRVDAGSRCYIHGDLELVVDVTAIEAERGAARIEFPYRTWSRLGQTAPATMTLIPRDLYPNDQLTSALLRLSSRYARDNSLPPALEDLLARRAPRLLDPSLVEGGLAQQEIPAIIGALDRSCLVIQGPPGSGKTTAAAQAIVHLLNNGATVGVLSNSHKAISNLISKCVEVGPETLRPLKVGGPKDDPIFKAHRSVRPASSGQVAGLLAHHPLVGGTAWLFSREELAGRLDYLFIDEAGQVPLANVAAVASAAKNLVLLGDPVQLPQPTQGDHPGASGESALGYALAGAATIDPAHGLFLDRSYRLHPQLCLPISEAFYEGRLQSAEGCDARRVLVGDRVEGVDREAGIVFVPVPHRGRTQSSPEEAERIQQLVEQLETCEITEHGSTTTRPLGREGILVVAPYNLQVKRLRRQLDDSVRIGSGDKFQGQEAPVVIVSLTASDAHESPRGLEFLLDPNRLNVALSRARSLAILVGAPGLAEPRCRSLEQLLRINLFFRLTADAAAP
jgi:uncharacterized protein